MRAVQVSGDQHTAKIAVSDSIAKPKPKHTDLLVHVHAAGITGDELSWPELYASPSRIPGHEISGTIAGLGPDYNGTLREGDPVFALLDATRGEGQAEYVVCSAQEIARKPNRISHAEASALPIPLLTAWEALFDHCNINSSSRVLITGASGAVGRVLVQLAVRIIGAQVVALASARNHEMLRGLGASEVLDYGSLGWGKTLEGEMDAVFDTAGGEILTKCWLTVKASGCIVTVADPAPAWAFGRGEAVEATRLPNVSYKYFIVSPNSEILNKMADLIDSGMVQALPVEKYPLHEAQGAWDVARTRGRSSKPVVTMRAED